MLYVTKVFEYNDSFFFIDDKTVFRIRSQGGSYPPLSDPWKPCQIIIGLKECYILQLKRGLNQFAFWILDHNAHYLTNTLSEAPKILQNIIASYFPNFPTLNCDSLDIIASPTEAERDFRNYQLTNLMELKLDKILIFNKKNIDEIIKYQNFWLSNEFLIIKNAINPLMLELLRKGIAFSQSLEQNNPRQFFRIHNDSVSNNLIRNFHFSVQHFFEVLLNSDLLPSAAFAMKYGVNAELLAHYDNIYTQISSTICFGAEPFDFINTLYLDKSRFSNPYQERITINFRDAIPEENVVKIDLAPGDLAIFRGRTHLHWRDVMQENTEIRALLIHFTDSKFNGKLTRPITIKHLPHNLIDFDNYSEFRLSHAVYFER
jgi:hypothetical protein